MQCYIITINRFTYASDSDTGGVIERKTCPVFFALDKAQATLQQFRSAKFPVCLLVEWRGADVMEGSRVEDRHGRMIAEVELRVGEIIDEK